LDGLPANLSPAHTMAAVADDKKISVFGVGRLGICMALCIERAGYEVMGVDIFPAYVDQINKKSFNSAEPRVNEFLQASKNFKATTDFKAACDFSDMLFILVDTPSTGGDRHYDCSKLGRVLNDMNKHKLQNKHIIICCTVLPGYIADVGRFLLRDCVNCTLSYNPEFIAQGDVINGLLNPDMVLIGQGSTEAGARIESIYKASTANTPSIHRMAPESAEITKLAVNCFVTMKISYANMIGDIADNTPGADKNEVLNAVGKDSRVGLKYLRPGYGFGGPCFPRDNRALGGYAKSVGVQPLLPIATDEYNKLHTQIQIAELLKEPKQEYTFTGVAYKENCTVPIIEESQKLVIAAALAKAGKTVTIKDSPMIVQAVITDFGKLFQYETI